MIDTFMLCGNDDDLELRLDVMKADEKGAHKLVGS